MSKIKKGFSLAGVGAALTVPVVAFAQEAPGSALEMAQSVDLADATSAILVAGGAILGLTVTVMGVMLVYRMIKGGKSA